MCWWDKQLQSLILTISPSDPHPITKLIILSENLCLMHAGPTLFPSVRDFTMLSDLSPGIQTSLNHDQLLGQLSAERASLSAPFEKSGVGYAGPFPLLLKIIYAYLSH